MNGQELLDRLKAACNGWPHARVAWPHRLLHDAIAEIEALRGLVAWYRNYKIERECFTADDWRVRAMNLEKSWSDCSMRANVIAGERDAARNRHDAFVRMIRDCAADSRFSDDYLLGRILAICAAQNSQPVANASAESPADT